MRHTMTKNSYLRRSASLTCIALLLGGCLAEPPSFADGLPPLRAHIDCLPKNAAIISAHRGTARGLGYAENSLGGLEHLMGKGILMAEIDVASTRDGVHFLYHDGVWENGSTGRGAVSAATEQALETVLLKTKNGAVTAERPPRLDDVLALAKDRLYLEIDFKSSAKEADIIEAIRRAGMTEQVVLITYSRAQSSRIARLAPEMLRSVPPNAERKGQLVWVGRDITRPRYAKPLKNMEDKRYIGRVGQPDTQQGLSLAKRRAAILVTDHAHRYLPVTGLTRKALPTYEACLLKAKS